MILLVGDNDFTIGDYVVMLYSLSLFFSSFYSVWGRESFYLSFNNTSELATCIRTCEYDLLLSARAMCCVERAECRAWKTLEFEIHHTKMRSSKKATTKTSWVFLCPSLFWFSKTRNRDWI